MYTPYANLPFYPGHVSMSPEISMAFSADYGPPRTNPDFSALYNATSRKLQTIMGTDNEMVLTTGEGMLGLWSALKCTMRPGDTMVSVGTGVFGDGFGDMASSIGCVVEKVSLPYDSTLTPEILERVDAAIKRLHPTVITAVHCETPSGTLNPLEALGALKKSRGVPLFVVDAVASIGGAPVRGDAWNVDILLGGSQKCLSCPTDMAFLSVSDTAWEHIAEVNYQGYEALLPFHNAAKDAMRFPYAPNWNGIAALNAGAEALLKEGLPKVFARHEAVAARCRTGLAELGIPLWTAPEAVNSPTVTAARIPEGFTWPEWQQALAAGGLIVGGSLGPMNGKVFRIGHMGSQADQDRMAAALNVMEQALCAFRLR